MKIGFFNKRIREYFFEKIGKLEILISFILIFWSIPEKNKFCAGIIFAVILLIIYVVIWLKANYSNNAKLSINNSNIEIKYGDIFNEKGKKVIALNEYFDTIVDDVIINRTSINGQFILGYINDINELDKRILKALKERRKKPISTNQKRSVGKKDRYLLGTTIKYDDNYLLTAFTKFNEDNSAELTMQEYINCLIELWDELNVLYSQNVVVIPLLGAGTTRFKGYDVGEQELLKIILWTFKISKNKFAYPSKICIVLHESIKNKINLFEIKEEFDNGV